MIIRLRFLAIFTQLVDTLIASWTLIACLRGHMISLFFTLKQRYFETFQWLGIKVLN